MTELTANAKAAVQEWPGATYHGNDLFELYHAEMDTIANVVETQDDEVASNEIDTQECYLGYSPNEDAFYSAFDCWYDETEECGGCDGAGVVNEAEDDEEDCDECGTNGYVESDVSQSFTSCVVRWSMDEDGNIETHGLVEGMYSRMFYSNDQLKDLHEKVPDLLDIRLD